MALNALSFNAATEVDASPYKNGSWTLSEGTGEVAEFRSTRGASPRSASGLYSDTSVVELGKGKLTPNDISAVYNDEQYHALLNEHKRLIRRKFETGLSHREDLELRMVRWAIDRAESALHENDFNRLNAIAEMQEKLIAQVNKLSSAK